MCADSKWKGEEEKPAFIHIAFSETPRLQKSATKIGTAIRRRMMAQMDVTAEIDIVIYRRSDFWDTVYRRSVSRGRETSPLEQSR